MRNVWLRITLCLMLIAVSVPVHRSGAALEPSDLWVDAEDGSDSYNGQTSSTAFQTIQKAADEAVPGTTVHVLLGVYRESVRPAASGTASEPIVYVAENGPGTVVIRGSELSSTLSWAQLGSNPLGLPPDVYYTDLSSWGLVAPPRFVVVLDGDEQVAARLRLAREPDWSVTTEWKHAEHWWTASGGASAATCDPATDPDPNCDLAQRSSTRLTGGDLTSTGNLVGGTLIALDTKVGHYVYRRTIVAHNVGAGRVTVDQPCYQDGGPGDPGLGWGSKYYVEDHPALLDTAGEWWYNTSDGHLYLWPPAPGNPAVQGIEISRRDHGFDLTDRSYIALDGLTVELFNESGVKQRNWYGERSYGNTVRNATLRYVNRGVHLDQRVDVGQPVGNVTKGFALEDSEIAHADTHAISLSDWWSGAPSPGGFPQSGIYDTLIRGNEMHHLGFRSDHDNAIGVAFQFANKLRFEDNHVHHVAHNGVQFSWSVIQSPKSYGFAPSEVKTGEILIQDNILEKACQLTTDCGALKFWGAPPDNHVFRGVLITGNVFRDTFGWSHVLERRGTWGRGGTESDVQGMAGTGLYLNFASGIHAYRNIAYNNAYAGFHLYGAWRDGDILFYNNVVANSLHGFVLGGAFDDTHGSVNTRLVDNIILNNEGYGILQEDADGVYTNLAFDHNLYYNNGWRPWGGGAGVWKPGAMVIYVASAPDQYYQSLAEIQSSTAWEDNGATGDPALWDYDAGDHDLFDGSWPDLHLTPASTDAIDRGTTTLPASLTVLLVTFGVPDYQFGSAFDIGRYEGTLSVPFTPSAQAIDPGGTARYTARLFPPGLSCTGTVTVTSPSLDLIVDPNPLSVPPGVAVTLTITHTDPLLASGVWYALPFTSTCDGAVEASEIGLLVGGARVNLPLILRGQ